MKVKAKTGSLHPIPLPRFRPLVQKSELARGPARISEMRGTDLMPPRLDEAGMSKPIEFTFRLFVAGNAQNSTRALANLNALCQAALPGRHHIEVVDIFRDPKLAMAEKVIMTPTLIKLSPWPVARIIGTLSHSATLLLALGLDGVPGGI
jgi:circadian clock protein KaiB